jgi:predicted ribosomally synthesized peptide with SipW-like signal peptide
MQKKNWKKKGILMLLLGGVCSVGAGVSMAWFTDEAEAVNHFRTGTQSVGLQESDWDPQEGDGLELYPGYTAYKNPTIKNESSAENGKQCVYSRLTVSIRDSQGRLICDPQALALIKETIRYDDTYTGTYDRKGSGTRLVQGQSYSRAMLGTVPMVNPLFRLDETRSTDNVLVFAYLGADGSGKLAAGEEAALFTDVVIPSDWSWEELAAAGDYVLDMVQESIQCTGFASQEAAFLALDQTDEKGGADS